MKRLSILLGGLVLSMLAFASPAMAAGSPSPSPTACPQGQFMSPLGCTLTGSNTGSDGAQSPVTAPTKPQRPITHHVRPQLPYTGPKFPLVSFAIAGAILVLLGSGLTAAAAKK